MSIEIQLKQNSFLFDTFSRCAFAEYKIVRDGTALSSLDNLTFDFVNGASSVSHSEMIQNGYFRSKFIFDKNDVEVHGSTNASVNGVYKWQDGDGWSAVYKHEIENFYIIRKLDENDVQINSWCVSSNQTYNSAYVLYSSDINESYEYLMPIKFGDVVAFRVEKESISSITMSVSYNDEVATETINFESIQ